MILLLCVYKKSEKTYESFLRSCLANRSMDEWTEKLSQIRKVKLTSQDFLMIISLYMQCQTFPLLQHPSLVFVFLIFDFSAD